MAAKGDTELGAFSISLAVKDLGVSLAFYEKLGFTTTGGDRDGGWLILKNDTCVLGLFEGMFEKNILTFNPGWAVSADGVEELDSFTDVRDLQQALRERGIELNSEADAGTGPASITLEDPDGNPILIDQHR